MIQKKCKNTEIFNYFVNINQGMNGLLLLCDIPYCQGLNSLCVYVCVICAKWAHSKFRLQEGNIMLLSKFKIPTIIEIIELAVWKFTCLLSDIYVAGPGRGDYDV